MAFISREDRNILEKFVKMYTISHYYPWIKSRNATPIVMRFYNNCYKIERIKEDNVQLIIRKEGINYWINSHNSRNQIANISIYQFITGLYELSRN